MKISGKQIIGFQLIAGGDNTFSAFNAATGAQLAPDFTESTEAEVALAFEKAEIAFESFLEVSRSRRADFLDAIAEEIIGLGEALIQRATLETGLPEGRITGERGRTVNQLKLFAEVVREGAFLDVSIDTAIPDRSPIPKPDIRKINLPLGPVAVFGASNFPLAFSVAGGDTASALAAGCPVVVKAHPAHPGTSELVGLAIRKAAQDTGMPDGVFSMVQGAGFAVGQHMVKHPLAKAAAFTGSFHGGKALFDLAASREEPIPCFAEMGSINPVFLLPERLEDQAETIASQFADSVNLGVGQFCTNPGIVFGLKSAALTRFIEAAGQSFAELAGGTMLHKGIRSNYQQTLKDALSQESVSLVAKGIGDESSKGIAHLLMVDGSSFIHNNNLQSEVFGPASIVVACDDQEQLLLAARSLAGNLTATLHATEEDLDQHKALLSILERKVGRLLINGFPTGVEVCHSMVHGGTYPATTDSRFTSVGTSAINRFLRPVCYQNFPKSALREELLDDQKKPINRRINGKIAP